MGTLVASMENDEIWLSIAEVCDGIAEAHRSRNVASAAPSNNVVNEGPAVAPLQAPVAHSYQQRAYLGRNLTAGHGTAVNGNIRNGRFTLGYGRGAEQQPAAKRPKTTAPQPQWQPSNQHDTWNRPPVPRPASARSNQYGTPQSYSMHRATNDRPVVPSHSSHRQSSAEPYAPAHRPAQVVPPEQLPQASAHESRMPQHGNASQLLPQSQQYAPDRAVPPNRVPSSSRRIAEPTSEPQRHGPTDQFLPHSQLCIQPSETAVATHRVPSSSNRPNELISSLNHANSQLPPSATASRTAKATGEQLAAAQLENYKRKVRALERELSQVKARLPSSSEPSLETLKLNLADAEKARQRAEKRAEFLELELQSRDEQRDFVEATQMHPNALTQQPSSQPLSTQLAASMSRLTPVKAKRRRSRLAAASPPPSTKGSAPSKGSLSPRPASSTRATKRITEEKDEADWIVPHSGWLHSYDGVERVAERVRAAAFGGTRARALLAHPDARKALHAPLARSAPASFARAHDTLAGSDAPPARRAALQLLLRAKIDARGRARAARAAVEHLRSGERELSVVQLAAAGARDFDPAVVRAIGLELSHGSVGAAAAAAELARGHTVSTRDWVDRLCVTAVDAARQAGCARFLLDVMAIVERVGARAPGTLLSLLENDVIGVRVARIVSDFGIPNAGPCALMQALVALQRVMARSGDTVFKSARARIVNALIKLMSAD